MFEGSVWLAKAIALLRVKGPVLDMLADGATELVVQNGLLSWSILNGDVSASGRVFDDGGESLTIPAFVMRGK
ncbi:hypothetical protein A2U01_0042706, partial [Trifolium medium]|nr:hypothetical protein [Trifolium medium]